MSPQADKTPADLDETLGLTVALLSCWLSGDFEAPALVLEPVDEVGRMRVLAMLMDVCGTYGVAVYGSRERFAQVLAAWRPGARLGDPGP